MNFAPLLVSASSIGTLLIIANAFYQREQFYSAVMYLTKSSFCMTILYSQLFILVLSFGVLCKKLFFGTLRQIEFEQLVEKYWFAFSETFVAFAVFRDEMDMRFIGFFVILLFLKAFHWLAEERIDSMERSPIIGRLFHVRMSTLIIVLSLTDVYFLAISVDPLIDKSKKGLMYTICIIFFFEYIFLINSLILSSVKYVLHTIDSYFENQWERKVAILLYMDLFMNFIKVLLYLFYVYLMIDSFTLPLFVIRPFYYTLRNFKKALTDLILSRHAIHIMNTLYPTATAEDLRNSDNVCIICREEMTDNCKKLPCNHIFHINCLTTWFQRQQTCPTCRLDILNSVTPNEGRNQGQEAQQGFVVNFGFRVWNLLNFNFGRDILGQNNQMRMNAFQNQQIYLQRMQQEQHYPQPEQEAQPQSSQSLQGSVAFRIPNMPYFSIPSPPPPLLEPILPPEELRSLSDEQLKELEGNARKNIEARIECLRNIQVLLNSAVIMMQQYNNSASAYPPTQSDSVPSTSSAADGINQN